MWPYPSGNRSRRRRGHLSIVAACISLDLASLPARGPKADGGFCNRSGTAFDSTRTYCICCGIGDRRAARHREWWAPRSERTRKSHSALGDECFTYATRRRCRDRSECPCFVIAELLRTPNRDSVGDRSVNPLVSGDWRAGRFSGMCSLRLGVPPRCSVSLSRRAPRAAG
jgi:hypothetical protein